MKTLDYECSACPDKAIDVRTEIISRDNETITKKVIYRCKSHLNTDIEELLTLSTKKQIEQQSLGLTPQPNPERLLYDSPFKNGKMKNPGVGHHESRSRRAKKLKTIRQYT